MSDRVVMVSEEVAMSAALTIASYAPESSESEELKLHLSTGTPGLTRWSAIDDTTLETVASACGCCKGDDDAMRIRSEIFSDLASRRVSARNNIVKISV